MNLLRWRRATDTTGHLTLPIATLPDGAGGHHTLTATFKFPTSADLEILGPTQCVLSVYLNGQEVPTLTWRSIDGIHIQMLDFDRALADRFTIWDGQPVVALTPAVLAAAPAPAHTPNLVFQPAAAAPLCEC